MTDAAVLAKSDPAATGAKPAEAEAATIAAPKKAEKSTHFSFEHKIFAVNDALFAKNEKTGEPGLFVPLGDLKAFLPLGDVRQQFKPMEKSDSDLLDVVEKSLKYVKEIRPGDSIPAELLDGSASWKVDPIHKQKARGRIFTALLGKSGSLYNDRLLAGEILVLETDEGFRRHVQEAVAAVARTNGLSDSRIVLDKVEAAAREMSYIEGLRDRYTLISAILRNVQSCNRLYRGVRPVLEEVSRIIALLGKPVKTFSDAFMNVDAQVGEINVLLRQMEKAIGFIRQNRDDLHMRLMVWDQLIEAWGGVSVTERSKRLESLVRSTYQFCARYFPQNEDWTLAR